MWHSIPVVRAPDDVHPAEGGEGAALDEKHDAGPDDVPDLGDVPELEGVTPAAAPDLATVGRVGVPRPPSASFLRPSPFRAREVHFAALVVGSCDLEGGRDLCN